MMKERVQRIIVILIIMTAFVISVDVPQLQAKEEVTKELQKDWWSQKFADHLLKLESREDDHIFLSADGFLDIPSEGDVFKDGDKFRMRSNHHSTAEFKIKKIEEDGIVLKYESRFDHSSFGKKLVTVDKGSFKVYWK